MRVMPARYQGPAETEPRARRRVLSAMYLRFVTAAIDPQSGARLGVFQAAFDLRRAGALEPWEEEQLAALLEWFDAHLDRPLRLRRSRRVHATDRAICWFKADARVHIVQMRALGALLDEHGVHVRVLRTDRPGYVVYEDAFQVAAEPFADSGA